MKKTQLVSAIGAVAGLSFAAGALAMDSSNPFQADDLDLGAAKLGLDDHKEGSCGEGKCGEGDDKDKEGACGEGSCGEGDDKEGSCGEGSCGEGSFGEA